MPGLCNQEKKSVMKKENKRMKVRKYLSLMMILIAVFLFAGCDDDDDSTNTQTDVDNSAVTNDNEVGAGGGLGDNAANENMAEEADEMEDDIDQATSIDECLQQVNDGQVPMVSEGETLDYGLGYFVYYTDIENAVDTLIYNAQVVRKQLADGDIAEGSLTKAQQNLLDITGDLAFDPDLLAEEQVQQSDDIRQAVINRVVEDQSGLSPQEALDSNEVIGYVAGHSIEDIGKKYLVYTQETPDADFEFLGTVIVMDADGQSIHSTETYNFEGWENLVLLGDASGPFWDNLPLGVSGDPANRDEGRPGILLVSQDRYEEMD
jgi:hypothetical protein